MQINDDHWKRKTLPAGSFRTSLALSAISLAIMWLIIGSDDGNEPPINNFESLRGLPSACEPGSALGHRVNDVEAEKGYSS